MLYLILTLGQVCGFFASTTKRFPIKAIYKYLPLQSSIAPVTILVTSFCTPSTEKLSKTMSVYSRTGGDDMYIYFLNFESEQILDIA